MRKLEGNVRVYRRAKREYSLVHRVRTQMICIESETSGYETISTIPRCSRALALIFGCFFGISGIDPNFFIIFF